MIRVVCVMAQNTRHCTQLCATAENTLMHNRLMRGNASNNNRDKTTLTIPAEKLYISIETFPTNKLPNMVRAATTSNDSGSPNSTSVSREKIFDNPIFAPGKKSGGSNPSIINAMSPSVVKSASIAIFFALIFKISSSRCLIFFSYSKHYNISREQCQSESKQKICTFCAIGKNIA